MQGVGFRPTALKIAKELNIYGEVKNSGGNVTIIAQSNKSALDIFVQRLIDLFEIKNYNINDISNLSITKNYNKFEIVTSNKDNQIPFITPDIATCKECEKELFDKNNPRYLHPFISCVKCGPRYTIINTLPYDRENTVMDKYEMCDDCNKEYTDANDRRCYAQTIACNHCGPKLNMPIDDGVKVLKGNEILAIKDIGGYHLSCKCTNECGKKLRQIKGRESKPFAVMFKDIDQIKEYCTINKMEKQLLLSDARPIVLLNKIKDLPIEICGDSDYIGAFLPCNPVQILILNKVSPLVMTSANISGEPIITDDEEIKKFGCKILSHDRPILTPIDDSILQVNCGKVQFIRRARGYVPLAIKINQTAKKTTLCMGADLKSTFGFVKDNYVFLSQYFGDLQDLKCFESYKNNIERFQQLHSFNVEKVVADKHPTYFSSNIFNNNLTLQHHLCHAYSVVAEHFLTGDCIHFVFDGTGYGLDGGIWGGEVFVNTTRVEHLSYTKMIASDEIAKDASLALACYNKSNELINKAIENNINTINSSSMGRLFDGVCALLDIKSYNTFEGECAIALEKCAKKSTNLYQLTPTWNVENIINEITKAKEKISTNNATVEDVAMGFHLMLSNLILITAKKYNIKQVTLSGGCFINRILTSNTIKLLTDNGFDVYINEKVPCGDSSIPLGQGYLSAIDDKEK